MIICKTGFILLPVTSASGVLGVREDGVCSTLESVYLLPNTSITLHCIIFAFVKYMRAMSTRKQRISLQMKAKKKKKKKNLCFAFLKSLDFST